MKKKFLIYLISLSSVLSLDAQIYTPSATIQGSSGNNNVGIGVINPGWQLTVKNTIALNGSSNQLLHIRPNSGYAGYIYWAENGVAERGILGFNASSGDLVYRSRATSFSDGTERFRIAENGNIGIGTTTPLSRLEVCTSSSTEIAKFSGANNLNYGTLKILGGTANNPYWRGIFIGANIKMNSTYPEIETSGFRGAAIGFGTDVGEGHIGFFTTSSTTSGNILNENMRISPTGNVGIGTTCPQYKLDVIGTIRTDEVKVDLTRGCDFVFKNDYKLMDLKELERFVKTNQHLPEISPEKEMVENGVNMKELQMKLLQKMEEMTLYIIDQNKKIETIEEQNKLLKQEIELLKIK